MTTSPTLPVNPERPIHSQSQPMRGACRWGAHGISVLTGGLGGIVGGAYASRFFVQIVVNTESLSAFFMRAALIIVPVTIYNATLIGGSLGHIFAQRVLRR